MFGDLGLGDGYKIDDTFWMLIIYSLAHTIQNFWLWYNLFWGLWKVFGINEFEMFGFLLWFGHFLLLREILLGLYSSSSALFNSYSYRGRKIMFVP